MSSYKEQNDEIAYQWLVGYIKALDEVFESLDKLKEEGSAAIDTSEIGELKRELADRLGLSDKAREKYRI